MQVYSRRRRTGWNGRTVAMTQGPCGASPFSGGSTRQQFDKAIVSRDPALKDYTLADNSPAWALGIEQIDMAIGPMGDIMST